MNDWSKLSRHIIELPDTRHMLQASWGASLTAITCMHNKLKIHSNAKFKRVPRVEWIPFAVVLNVSHGFKNIFFIILSHVRSRYGTYVYDAIEKLLY